MRYICFVLVLLGLPGTAAAQHTRRDTAAPPPTSALGPIGLPLPPIGLPPFPIDGTRPSPQQPRRDDRRDSRGYGPRSRPPVVYVVPAYPWVGGSSYPWFSGPSYPTVAPPSSVSAPTPPPPWPDTGRLRFEVEPSDLLQVFVDGIYVGTPRDVGRELELQPGSRRIEFRAPGYRTLVVDAQIVAQRSITYQGALDALAQDPSVQRITPPPSPPPTPMPAGSKTLYIIPGCYLGNVRPDEVQLPAGCDLSRLMFR